MILTLHLPPLARERGLCDIDMRKFESSVLFRPPRTCHVSEFFWTINYRYHIVPAL